MSTLSPEALVNRLNASTGARHRIVITYRFEAPMKKGKIGQAEGRVEAYVERIADDNTIGGRNLGTLAIRSGAVVEFMPGVTTPYVEAKPVLDALR